MDSEGQRPHTLPHERRVFVTALLAGAPALAIALALLWLGDHSLKVRLTLSLLAAGTWLGASLAVRGQVVRPLQTLSNILAALREEDFSLRARGASAADALGLAFLEANTLGETLRTQRLGALEASALVRQVMEEIDVALFAVDDAGVLRLVNRAGAELLGEPPARLIGRSAAELPLAPYLDGVARRTVQTTFSGRTGRWEIRRSTFRQEGRPHRLVVISDITRTVREEEIKAWQRLVRVLSHEINNSLAPIKSIAATLRDQLRREPRPADWEHDVHSGLDVIAGRAGALAQFIASYARLTRLPPPRRSGVDVESWVRRVAALETRLGVRISGGPPVLIDADGDQLDQLLINLVRNAADAALETGGGVELSWTRRAGELVLRVADEGPGLADTANLFVPFFTTKPSGSGIGLALCRQIAEAHGGSVSLGERETGTGCVATVTLPVGARGD